MLVITLEDIDKRIRISIRLLDASAQVRGATRIVWAGLYTGPSPVGLFWSLQKTKSFVQHPGESNFPGSALGFCDRGGDRILRPQRQEPLVWV